MLRDLSLTNGPERQHCPNPPDCPFPFIIFIFHFFCFCGIKITTPFIGGGANEIW